MNQSDLDHTYVKSFVTLRSAIGELVEPKKLSQVQVLDVDAFDRSYWYSSVRLMIVGQQTYRWGEAVQWDGKPEDIVEALKGCYRRFALGTAGYSSPFWNAAHELYRLLCPTGPQMGFLWSNLLKLDQNGKRPKDIEDVLCNCFNVLPEEIRLASPTVVVFFTGRTYDDRLRKSFLGCELCPASSRPVNELALVQAPGLPRHTYRTYHPKYLRLSDRWDILQEIAKLCEH